MTDNRTEGSKTSTEENKKWTTHKNNHKHKHTKSIADTKPNLIIK